MNVASSGYIRISANFATDVAHALRSYAEQQGISLTEALRRAISLLLLLTEEGTTVKIRTGSRGPYKHLSFRSTHDGNDQGNVVSLLDWQKKRGV